MQLASLPEGGRLGEVGQVGSGGQGVHGERLQADGLHEAGKGALPWRRIRLAQCGPLQRLSKEVACSAQAGQSYARRAAFDTSALAEADCSTTATFKLCGAAQCQADSSGGGFNSGPACVCLICVVAAGEVSARRGVQHGRHSQGAAG